MSLSRKEQEEMRPVIDRTVTKFLGFKEPTLVTAAIKCLDSGYDKHQTVSKLSEILDEEQASKFGDRLFLALEDYKLLTKLERNRKRREKTADEGTGSKKKRFDDASIPDPGNPSPGQLTADKIKEMMASAQRVIQERKLQLNFTENKMQPQSSTSQQLMEAASEKAKKAAEMHARIQAQMSQMASNTGTAGLGFGAGTMPPQSHGLGFTAQVSQVFGPLGPKAPSLQFQPTPLILDDQGRTIDAKTGETITLKHHMPTLKANIRAKKREQFRAVQDKPPEEITESRFFDPRVSGKAAARSKRGFQFHDQGKFETMAQRLRTKAQLEKLQEEIAHTAKRTGIASASKLAAIAPKKDTGAGYTPEVEWWDQVLMQMDSYDAMVDEDFASVQGITHLVEHPIQMKPPAEPDKVIQMPVHLTARERKKLRRQNRMEAQKEVTEKIRLGLIAPPEPKVRMANLMRVLGTEAVQDPTKVEAHVRAQMAKRLRDHLETNQARKLTKDEKREKKARKLKEDTSLGVHVALYRVNDLSNPSKKFKVETNANQLYLTGIVILHKDCNVVVVEGGPKQQRKFRRLMLQRIKWNEDSSKSKKNKEDTPKVPNKCCLVWEGTVQTRAFSEVKFKACPTESFAREQFRKSGVEHYWNLAYSGAVMELASSDA